LEEDWRRIGGLDKDEGLEEGNWRKGIGGGLKDDWRVGQGRNWRRGIGVGELEEDWRI
jgi:hypothetical protein